MNKLKLFLENFFVYGIGGIISNVIPLIMVPVVLKILPDSSYYGLSDLSNTVVQFGTAVAIMGMYDAMYRMFFEKEDDGYKKKVCSTALCFSLVVSCIVFVIMLLLKDVIAQCFLKNGEYTYLIYICAIAVLVGATNSIVSAPTRMQNKRKVFLVTNTIGPVLAYSISIPMLIKGHYIIALPLASAVSALSIEIVFAIMNRNWFDYRCFDKKILKQLLMIALPLFPNFLVYWIFNSCDKVMIANLIDVGAEGVYSVGSKLGQASQLIYIAFAGGWQYFSFSTMKEESQVRTNSMVFEYLGVISFAATSLVCALSYGIYKVLFEVEYLEGYVIAPYLFFAPLLQMLFQVLANQFVVIKKTWPNILILLFGAVVNLILNALLIPILGIEGAAIATLMGYVVSVVVCALVLLKMSLLTISARFIGVTVCMLCFVIVWRLFFSTNVIIGVGLAICMLAGFVLLYKVDLRLLLSNLTNENK